MIFFQAWRDFPHLSFVADQELQRLIPEVLRTDIQLLLHGYLTSLLGPEDALWAHLEGAGPRDSRRL